MLETFHASKICSLMLIFSSLDDTYLFLNVKNVYLHFCFIETVPWKKLTNWLVLDAGPAAEQWTQCLTH